MNKTDSIQFITKIKKSKTPIIVDDISIPFDASNYNISKDTVDKQYNYILPRNPQQFKYPQKRYQRELHYFRGGEIFITFYIYIENIINRIKDKTNYDINIKHLLIIQ